MAVKFMTPRGVPADSLRRNVRYRFKLKSHTSLLVGKFVRFISTRGKPLQLDVRGPEKSQLVSMDDLQSIEKLPA